MSLFFFFLLIYETSNTNPNHSKCIHLIEWFDYHNHICMVFELLGPSVFDFLKANEFRPFPIHHIQQFAKQILTSVACKFIITTNITKWLNMYHFSRT